MFEKSYYTIRVLLETVSNAYVDGEAVEVLDILIFDFSADGELRCNIVFDTCTNVEHKLVGRGATCISSVFDITEDIIPTATAAREEVIVVEVAVVEVTGVEATAATTTEVSKADTGDGIYAQFVREVDEIVSVDS